MPRADPFTLLAVGLYFLVMLAVGFRSWRQSEASLAGFLLGGRQLGPAVTALSAGASDMSAWLLMGLPGAMVASGLVSSWIAIGLAIGAWCNYRFVAPGLRIYTEQLDNALTLPEYFTRRFHDESHWLRVMPALVIVIFFTLYTASGIVAGGVLFESAFGLSYTTGTLLICAVVVAYTFLGGFQAVCMTDFIQGCIMLVALIVVPIVALTGIGDTDWPATLAQEGEGFLNLFGGMAFLAIVSNLAWGLGYFGQPHIIVRFMAIHSPAGIRAARRIGMSWMILSLFGAMTTGLCGLAYMRIHNLPLDDPETIFIVMTQILFHPLVGGVLLAAILAAVMSTISSQLLVSASSLSQDGYRVFFGREATERSTLLVSRFAVLAVAMLALAIALQRDSTILSLVGNAWAGFGAAFGPLVLFSLFWRDMNRNGALAGMLAGAVTVLLWIYLPLPDGGSLSDWLYEIIPGFIMASLAIAVVSRMTGGAGEPVRTGFTEMQRTRESTHDQPASP